MMNQNGKWHKGYTHYHSSFRYPEGERIDPRMLADDLRKMGADFIFCAGDHGTAEGDKYWGLDIREFADYKKACVAASNEFGVVFVPAPEIHLMFPPFYERHEHHACVPILDYVPRLEFPESRALAASYTRDVESFVKDVKSHNISVTLNHPCLSLNTAFSGPDPLSIPVLHRFDYLELYTIDHPDKFPYDFDIYLKFLSDPLSAMMACCGGIDNAMHPERLLSDEKRIVPATCLYATREQPASEDIMAAWNERKSYTVYGDLKIEQIQPVPGREIVKTDKNPVINLSVHSRKKITQTEIYRNGMKVYAGKEFFTWQDQNPLPGENHYIVHITAEDEHLVTSPINYLIK